MWRFVLVLSGALLLTSSGELQAQDPSPQEVVAQGSAVESPLLQDAAPLPARAVPERTLRPYWHVFGAFAITWVLLFGYALSLGRRLAGIEREMGRLEGRGAAPR